MYYFRLWPRGLYSSHLYRKSRTATYHYEGLQPGGQLTITTEVENFPGFADGIDANELMDSMRKQAERFGADIRTATATKVDLSQSPYTLWFDDDTVVKCRTLVIATGASAKYLGLSDEKKYQGLGVSACATCDGFFYRKRWWP